ncbi:hypothetical protein B0H14DRAFT_2631498 [Mycena olivaceomarginata]|nr:hypothetical protein B0H14DRAFT_2631498 [Mycena olivaceomarginata]
MDDRRPSLNVDPLKTLQIDKNVPVIAVFTKCDAFRRNIRMDLEDQDELRRNTRMDLEDEDEEDADDYLDWLTDNHDFTKSVENVRGLMASATRHKASQVLSATSKAASSLYRGPTSLEEVSQGDLQP